MTERSLLVMAAVGAAAVAYAVYLLLGARMADAPPHAGVGATEASSEARVGSRSAGRSPESSRRVAATPNEPAAGIDRWDPSEHARAQPEITLEEAREKYVDLVVELEREVQRTKDSGKQLPGKDWVEYYARFHDVMNPLRALMSAEDEDQQAELTEMSEQARALLDKLQEEPPHPEE